MKSALILYPNQLFPLKQLPEVDTVIIVEDPLFFGIDREFPQRIHKQKIILHRASIQRYIEEVLWPANVNVDYVALDGLFTTQDIFERARKFDRLFIFDPVDDVITKRLLEARRADSSIASFEFLTNPNFYLNNTELQQYFYSKHRYEFDEFYQWQRERFNILIDEDYKPEGGKWIFNERKVRLPHEAVLPSFGVFGSNKYVDEAIKYVKEHFPDNPGGTDFIWPTSHEEATIWLDDFLSNRLESFADFDESIDSQAVWMYHSALSSSLNIGLLSSRQVVSAAIERHKKRPVKLANLETFIRQILGWREYTRGQYLTKHVPMRTANTFGHKRKLTNHWRDGTLGIPPFDNMIKRINDHGYVHHAERLMIAGNLMLLSEIDPKDVYKWFSELFIDSYDWVMLPNVYNICQMIEIGTKSIKPHISGSDFILDVSNYKKGDWCDVWDGLLWRFIDKNHSKFQGNSQMKLVVEHYKKLDTNKRRIIGYRAEDFLNKFTK
ncbi:MAG: cryptochrome/photolyase family protein [Candidatus Saccharimonadales bacterium]